MELPKNTFKAAIKAGKPQIGLWSSLSSNYSVEVIAGAGFDWLLLDMEHSPNDLESLLAQMQAAAAYPSHPIVRVPWNEPSVIMKVLDAGAYGVIVPMVSNRAEAERAVAACRYPPVGMRSNGPNRVMQYAGADYQKYANDEVACVVMIETPEGIEKMDEIISTPGVDAAYIGPTDLALSLGLPPVMDNDEPKHVETVNRILAACKRAGIIAGIHTNSSKFTQRYLDQGFTEHAAKPIQLQDLLGAIVRAVAPAPDAEAPASLSA